MARPFRFLADGRDVSDGVSLAERARKAQDLGFDALVIPDHLIDQLSPVVAMTAIAAATDRLRVGTFVLNNDLRHPAVLAQDLASLDVISGGRLDIGIGAGWNKPEYDAAGIAFDPVPIRVDRMAEAIAVLKGLFADGTFSFEGTYYTISEMDGRPTPVQRPHPPFLIGGGGRRILSIAGREAQIVGLAPRIGADGRADIASVLAPATAEKIEWVRQAAGDRFDQIELNMYPSVWGVTVTDDPRGEAATLIARLGDRVPPGVGVDEVLDAPHIFINTLEGFVDKFQALREQFGISSIMVGAMDDLAPVVSRLAGT